MSTSMNRLDFRLPEYTRIGWASKRARAAWEQRLRAITYAYMDIEVQSVAQGLRGAVRTMVAPADLAGEAHRMSKMGLSMLPLSRVGAMAGSYSIQAAPPGDGGDWTYMVLFHKGIEIGELDDRSIGSYLGYPPCCTAFYDRVWNEEQHIDTTWPMALTEINAVDELDRAYSEGTISATPLLYCNILPRFVGVRAVPHLPCGFQCAETQAMGGRMVALGRELGYGQEMDDMEEVLSWPAEWNVLHGCAEVTLPVLRISTVTDATPGKYVVRLRGSGYPTEGVSGLKFPFRLSTGNVLTQGRAFRNVTTPSVTLPWYYEDNGFKSYRAQTDHHAPLIEAMRRAGPKRVLDLGCGNGALLLEALEQVGEFTPFGVDVDGARIDHARTLHPQYADNFRAGRMEDYTLGQYDLVLHQPGHANDLAYSQSLSERAGWLLLYVYGDGDKELLEGVVITGVLESTIDTAECSARLYRITQEGIAGATDGE